MIEQTDKAENLPSDDEISKMLSTDSASKKGRSKTDDTRVTPRLPEAVYYFLFLMLETAIFMGVLGDMSRGERGKLEIDILGLLWSIVEGLLQQLQERWWMAAGILVASASVFMPSTPRGRKRIARLVGGVIAASFAVLIAFQFNQDMAALGSALDWHKD